MAATAILDSKNLEILTTGTVKRVKLSHHAKFCRNWSNHGGDMAIFRFLKMAATAILDFSNFNNRNAQKGGAASPSQILSKSVKPQQRNGNFSIFQAGGRRHIGFLQRAQCSHCKRCISYSNSVRPSVCLSVTCRYCVKTTARSMVQFAPLDSKMCLVL